MKQANKVQAVWIFVCFQLLLPGPAVAKQDLTLDEAVATLIQFNPQVDIATEQWVQGQGIFTQVRSGYLPRVTVGGDVSRQHIQDLEPVDEDTLGRGSVSLSQLIYDFGRTTGAIDSSRFSLQASEANLKSQLPGVAISLPSMPPEGMMTTRQTW